MQQVADRASLPFHWEAPTGSILFVDIKVENYPHYLHKIAPTGTESYFFPRAAKVSFYQKDLLIGANVRIIQESRWVDYFYMRLFPEHQALGFECWFPGYGKISAWVEVV